ncbi:hypothetical protein AOQ84DRAFT_408814 [Glonium stellatum]|uniref:Uncharacterized protein n=1 Tax=Glonium stellatum TaxID=574774 RepID=A0A8E2F054_9PEZI|nr:hypothetical protein AOQ84DRAFT_408814 [Glonium stellatum]
MRPENWLMPPTNRVSFGPNRTAVFEDKEFRYYHFGPTFSFGRQLSNATFMIGKQWMNLQNREYILAAVTAFLGNNSNCNGCDFVPIGDFSRNDADVSLLGLMNLATYTGPVNDSWFQPTSEPYEQNRKIIGWFTNTNMSFVGCTEQYQICTRNRCSPLTNLYAPNYAKSTLESTEAQSATFDLLWKDIWGTSMEYLVVFLGADVLRAQESLYRLGFISSALETGYWRVEMENIHNVSIVFAQRRYVNFANPPNLEVRPNITIRQYLQEPGEPQRFCKHMKVRSSEHSCFSVIKLASVLITGAIIMLLSPALPAIVSRFQRRSQPGRYRRMSWSETNIMRLHQRYLGDPEIGL